MQIGNKCPGLQEYHDFGFCRNSCEVQCVPASVLVQIENKLRVDKHIGDYVSTTALLGCLRQLYLERKVEYYEEPVKNWYSIRGTLLHNILENPDFAALVGDMRKFVLRARDRNELTDAELFNKWLEIEVQLNDLAAKMPKVYHIEDWQSETEYELPLGVINGRERKLKGTIDVLRAKMGKILDYKTCGDRGIGVIKRGAKKEHILQFNIYRLLVERGYPVGMSYETYHPPKINSIEAYYMTMMQVVGTGRLLSEKTDWRNSTPTIEEGATTVGDPEVIDSKTVLVTKKGKRKMSTNPDDFDLVEKKKYRITYAVPDVPLMDLDEVELFVRAQAPILFDAFERGIMPPMCAPEMRLWKCESYCPDQVRQACDKHNETVGDSRIVAEEDKPNFIPIGELVEP